MKKQYHIAQEKYSHSALLEKAAEMRNNASLSVFFREAWAFIAEWLNDADTVVLQTSGSTGAPKIIKVEKRFMRNSALMTVEFLHIKKGDKALLCLPANYIAGKMMIVRALECGLDLWMREAKGNTLTGNQIFDFAAMVPMQVENILNHQPEDLDKVKKLILGGAAVKPDLQEKLQSCTSEIWHSYGMTETVSHIALRRLNGATKSEHYRAMPGVDLRVDERGCLQISAPHLNPEVVTTNDIVALEEEGSFSFLGRYDNVINSGGVKISPELVEQKISALIRERFIISSKTDERLGERVVLIIEGEAGKYNPTALLENIKPLVNKFEMPKEILFTESFAETESGKIKRHLLRS